MVNQRRMIVRVLLTLVLTRVAFCIFNLMCKYLDYLKEIYPPKKLAKTIGNTAEFPPGQDSRYSPRSTIAPIWVGGRGGRGQLQPVKVRLIGGGAELPPGMDVIGELRLTVCFGKRTPIGQGERNALARNTKNRRVLPLVLTARGYSELEEYSSKMGISI